jgi:hypothetical protein
MGSIEKTSDSIPIIQTNLKDVVLLPVLRMTVTNLKKGIEQTTEILIYNIKYRLHGEIDNKQRYIGTVKLAGLLMYLKFECDLYFL